MLLENAVQGMDYIFVYHTDDPGIVLGMDSANGRRGYIITSSLIGWAHTQNDPRGPMIFHLMLSSQAHQSQLTNCSLPGETDHGCALEESVELTNIIFSPKKLNLVPLLWHLCLVACN